MAVLITVFLWHKIATTHRQHCVLAGVYQLSDEVLEISVLSLNVSHLEINVLCLNVSHDINITLLLCNNSARSV